MVATEAALQISAITIAIAIRAFAPLTATRVQGQPLALSASSGRFNVRRPWTLVGWRWNCFIHLRFKLGRLLQQGGGNCGVFGHLGELKKNRRLTHEILSTDHSTSPVVSQLQPDYAPGRSSFQRECTKVNIIRASLQIRPLRPVPMLEQIERG